MIDSGSRPERSDRPPPPWEAVVIAGCALAIAAWWIAHVGWFVWWPDQVALIRLAEELRVAGTLPVHGILSSRGSYNMPGLPWLLTPAALAFRDPRWIVAATNAPLYLLSLVLLYRLGRRLLPKRHALLCCALFAFLPRCASFATMAWAQAYLPPLYVAICWLLAGWLLERRPWKGAAACLVIGASVMIHFSAIVWFLCWGAVCVASRGNLRLRSSGVAALILLALLTPYIHFQFSREFRDLRSFITGKHLLEKEDATESTGEDSANSSASAPQSPSPGRLSGAAKAIRRLSWANFETWLSVDSPLPRRAFKGLHTALGIMFLVGCCAAIGPMAGAAAQGWRRKRTVSASATALVCRLRDDKQLAAACLALFLTWTPILIVALMGYSARVTFVWTVLPLQCLLAVFGARALARLAGRRWTWGRSAALAILPLCAAGFLLAGGVYLARKPISGSYTAAKLAIDFIAEHGRLNGLSEASVSYEHLPPSFGAQAFVPRFHELDPGYYIGMEFDYLLERLHGLSVPSRAADGFDPDARYILVSDGWEDKYPDWNGEAVFRGRYTVLVRARGK
jgi:4-amino-4-deoxy-L-arabinose transferase-like glycosyltransferase